MATGSPLPEYLSAIESFESAFVQVRVAAFNNINVSITHQRGNYAQALQRLNFSITLAIEPRWRHQLDGDDFCMLGIQLNETHQIQRLKDHTLRSLSFDPARGRYEILDPLSWGHGTFGVRVNKTSISFIFVYVFHGPQRRMVLGRYPEMSLTDARALAHRAAQLVEEGIDPGKKQVLELFQYRESPSVADAVAIYLKWAQLCWR